MNRLRILLVVNKTKPDAVRAGLDITAWCRSRGIECANAALGVEPAPGAVACALGGDGTVLRAASLVDGTGIPVLGVNVGSLGFLSQTPLDGLFPALECLARGEFGVEKRMRLAYRAGSVSGTALNDVIIAGVAPRLLDIRVTWRGEPAASLHADGMIFSTPTGTTAYSLSLGGPIAVPTADCIVMTPHAAHVLGVRSLVFAQDDELQASASADVRLVADGDTVGQIPAGTGIAIARAEAPTLLVRPDGAPGFFPTLTDKLNWPSADPRRAR